MWWREELENASFSQYVQFHLKFLGKYTQALVISKRLKFPQDDRTDTNSSAPLKMLLNGTLDSLKVFSMYLGGNRRWVPLITVYWKAHQYSGICKLLECSIRYQYSVILKYRYVLFRQIWFGIGTPFKIAFTFYFIAGESELLIKKKEHSLSFLQWGFSITVIW